MNHSWRTSRSGKGLWVGQGVGLVASIGWAPVLPTQSIQPDGMGPVGAMVVGFWPDGWPSRVIEGYLGKAGNSGKKASGS